MEMLELLAALGQGSSDAVTHLADGPVEEGDGHHIDGLLESGRRQKLFSITVKLH